MEAPRLLVFGATGMAGQALLQHARKRGWPTCGASRRGPDLVCDMTVADTIEATLSAARPDIVINAAALVDIAACAGDPGAAYRINALPAAILAKACARRAVHFVQISTDHYFTGAGDRPHSEDAAVTLLNDYARTKYAGEAFALTNPEALIVRTNITGPRGWPDQPTFFEWCMKVIEYDEHVTLFTDYYTSTLDTDHFAAALLDLAAMRARGLVHLGARDVFSKARFVTVLAERFDRSLTKVVYSSVHGCLGDRAESLGLDVSRAERLLGRSLPTLAEVVAALKAQYGERRCGTSPGFT